MAKRECRGDGYKAYKKISLTQCTELCSKDKKCKYIDYATKKRRGTSLCELNRICEVKKDKRFDIFSKFGKKAAAFLVLEEKRYARMNWVTTRERKCLADGYKEAGYISYTPCKKLCAKDKKCKYMIYYYSVRGSRPFCELSRVCRGIRNEGSHITSKFGKKFR